MSDLILSGNSCSIRCNCSRFTVDNYNLVLETWLKKSDVQLLRNNVRPGACKDLYSILGLPHNVDTSWSKANTIRIIPNVEHGSNLPYMRSEKIGYCKSIQSEPLEGSSGWINVKMEFLVSSTANL
jgi:hypothetical protein